MTRSRLIGYTVLIRAVYVDSLPEKIRMAETVQSASLTDLSHDNMDFEASNGMLVERRTRMDF